MSQPPGPPDPSDPWATPTGEPSGPSAQPEDGQPPSGQPPYGAPDPYGQQPPYEPYGYQPYGQPRGTSGMAMAAMWTGIGALVLSLCCGAGILAGPVAIGLGAKARRDIQAGGGAQGGAGMALSGIITGIVAVLLSLAVLAVLGIAIARGGSSYTGYETRA